MGIIVYVGIDVHKDQNTVCLFTREEDNLLIELGKIPAGTEYMVKALKKAEKEYFKGQDVEWKAGYEAGPTGYGLCKGLQKKGIDCGIMAPTTIIKASGERTKTDRRDAASLAMALANGTYKPVHLLDDEDSSAREITRLRGSIKNKLEKEKQNLLSFLLGVGKSYPESGNYWTQKHFDWLNAVHFDDILLEYSFQTYLAEIRASMELLARIDARIGEMANTERYKDNAAKLVCFTGIQTHAAVSLLCEMGDFTRFETAEQFSAYIGLVPGQDSSGKRQCYTSITKTGNGRIRLLLTEAAKGIKNSNPFQKSKRIQARQALASPDIVLYADKGTRRIKCKMSRMEKNGKNANVATTAGARELACFVWGMMTGNIA